MALTVTNTGRRKVSVSRGKTVCLHYHSPISSLGGGGGNGGGGGGGESNSLQWGTAWLANLKQKLRNLSSRWE